MQQVAKVNHDGICVELSEPFEGSNGVADTGSEQLERLLYQWG